jgi:PIF1-like helicase
MNVDLPFGGLILWTGGDLRQLSPICGNAELEQDIHYRFSWILLLSILLELTKNMRALGDEREFADLLKLIGEGRQPCPPALPPMSFVVPPTWVIEQKEDLIRWCFGDDPAAAGATCAILTHLNRSCKEINHMVII